MNQLNKYQAADQAAEIFCIVFFGVLIFLGAVWLLNLAGEILVNIEGTLISHPIRMTVLLLLPG